ncbi:hypothetical protein [Sinorhizobium meliloti]|uniref:hypothetical protein n=1 Tax=Rhizobium meliloti TaxID=382 RepID=UPI001E60F14C|nr:hypothetical protein [Sinorhizobium meliloti]UFX13074.1 hypothetical protein SmelRRI128_33545 [Sinorhizobium meliloti]
MTTIGVVFVRHGTRIKLIAILFAYRRTVQKLFMHQSQVYQFVLRQTLQITAIHTVMDSGFDPVGKGVGNY